MPDAVLDGWATTMNKWTKKPNPHRLSIQLAGEIGGKPLAIDKLRKLDAHKKELRATEKQTGDQGVRGEVSGVRAG